MINWITNIYICIPLITAKTFLYICNSVFMVINESEAEAVKKNRVQTDRLTDRTNLFHQITWLGDPR